MDLVTSRSLHTEKITMVGEYFMALQNLRRIGVYHNGPQKELRQTMSLIVCAVHFRQKVLPSPEILQWLECSARPDVSNGHLGFINVICNIRRRTPYEILQNEKHSKSGKNPIVKLEHKSIIPTKDLLCKSFEANSAGSGSFCRHPIRCQDFSAASKQRRLDGCPRNLRCLDKSISNHVEAWATQPPKQASDLTGNENLMEPTRTFLNTDKGKSLRGVLNSWKCGGGWRTWTSLGWPPIRVKGVN